MNKKFYGLVIASMMLSLISGCSSKDDLKVNEKSLSVELGEQVSTKAETYLDKNTDKEVIKNTKITFKANKAYTIDKKEHALKAKEGNFLPVGNYKVSLKYEDEQKDIVVTVKDTKAPSFKDFKDEVSIEVGNTDDLNSLYTAEDLSTVTITVDQTKVDINKEGTYEVKVIASDQYKNKATKKATVKVVAKQVAVETPTEPAQATAGTNNNQSGAVASGSTSSSGGSNAGNSTTTPPANNTGGTGGSNTGDVCVPADGGNVGILFDSMEEAGVYADGIIYGKENSSKGFDDIPGNYAFTYGAFTAGCGKWYLHFWYE